MVAKVRECIAELEQQNINLITTIGELKEIERQTMSHLENLKDLKPVG